GVIVVNWAYGRRGWRGAARNHYRVDEFIGHAAFVAAAHGFDRVGRFHRSVAVDDSAIGAFHSLPAIVAIHRIVTAGERCDLSAADLADFLLQLLDVFDAAMRRSIAAI